MDNMLDKALELISEFAFYEYGTDEEADDARQPTENLENIGILYSSYGEEEQYVIEVTADLIHFRMNHYANGVLVRCDQYADLETMIAEELECLDFDGYYSATIEAADFPVIEVEEFDEEITPAYQLYKKLEKEQGNFLKGIQETDPAKLLREKAGEYEIRDDILSYFEIVSLPDEDCIKILNRANALEEIVEKYQDGIDYSAAWYKNVRNAIEALLKLC